MNNHERPKTLKKSTLFIFYFLSTLLIIKAMQIKTDFFKAIRSATSFFFFFNKGQPARGRKDTHPVHSWQVCKLAHDKEYIGTAQPNPASRNVP